MLALVTRGGDDDDPVIVSAARGTPSPQKSQIGDCCEPEAYRDPILIRNRWGPAECPEEKQGREAADDHQQSCDRQSSVDSLGHTGCALPAPEFVPACDLLPGERLPERPDSRKHGALIDNHAIAPLHGPGRHARWCAMAKLRRPI